MASLDIKKSIKSLTFSVICSVNERKDCIVSLSIDYYGAPHALNSRVVELRINDFLYDNSRYDHMTWHEAKYTAEIGKGFVEGKLLGWRCFGMYNYLDFEYESENSDEILMSFKILCAEEEDNEYIKDEKIEVKNIKVSKSIPEAIYRKLVDVVKYVEAFKVKHNLDKYGNPLEEDNKINQSDE